MSDVDFDFRTLHSGQHDDRCPLCVVFRNVHAEHDPSWECPTHPSPVPRAD